MMVIDRFMMWFSQGWLWLANLGGFPVRIWYSWEDTRPNTPRWLIVLSVTRVDISSQQPAGWLTRNTYVTDYMILLYIILIRLIWYILCATLYYTRWLICYSYIIIMLRCLIFHLFYCYRLLHFIFC